MAAIVKGKYVLDAISHLKEPAHLTDIVNYLAPNFQQPKSTLRKAIKTALEAGVRFGYIKERDGNYYTVELSDGDVSQSDKEVVNLKDNVAAKAKSAKAKSAKAIKIASAAKNKKAMDIWANVELNSDDEDCSDMRRTRSTKRRSSRSRSSRLRSSRSRSGRSRSGKRSRSASRSSRSPGNRSRRRRR